MHDHNNGKGSNSMMWMMIPCLLLIVIFIVGGSGLVSSKYFWLIILGICVVPHLWMMFKGHGDTSTKTEEKSNTTVVNKDNKHGGSCCH